MEDLQSALQSILSDPVQMQQIQSMAAALGLQPPGQGPGTGGDMSGTSDASGSGGAGGSGAAIGDSSPMERGSAPANGPVDPEQAASAAGLPSGPIRQGLEERVFRALRPGLSADGQARIDRALRAARLSRMAGVVLKQQGFGHV